MRYLAVICMLLGSLSGAAISEITGATVQGVVLRQNTATITVLNRADQEITGFSLAVTATLADGRTVSSERTVDYGPPQTAAGKALHAHDTTTETATFGPGEAPISVQARVVAVIYQDRTAEASDDEALSRILEHRTSLALMDSITVQVLETSLSDTADQHPSVKAARAVKDLAVPSGYKTGVDKAYMRAVSEDFERAPREATRLGMSERQYLTERLAAIRQRAADEESYAQVRRKP
jgi:hypothetical protein